ncbi:MAG: hypothetical protein R2764_18100 [Bacteroidales bacterium]
MSLKSLLIVIPLIVGTIWLQAREKPSFIGIRSGVSVPIGKYHATTFDKGSFALAGFNVSAEGAWFFKPKFGVGASVGFNMHPVDVYRLGWESVQDDPFLMDVTIRSDPYQVFTAMAGLYTQLPIKGKISFTGKLLGGLLYGKTPYQLFKPVFFMTGPAYYEKTSSRDYKFSWQAGIGFRYDISPVLGLYWILILITIKLSFGLKPSGNLL